MFTAYDGQKFETLEKCEVHNKQIKEDMVARDEEKKLAEAERIKKLDSIQELFGKLNKELKEYEEKYSKESGYSAYEMGMYFDIPNNFF